MHFEVSKITLEERVYLLQNNKINLKFSAVIPVQYYPIVQNCKGVY